MMKNIDTRIHIDAPMVQESTILFHISGWIASNVEIEKIEVGDFQLMLAPRPDVLPDIRQREPNASVDCAIGFSGLISQYEINDHGILLKLTYADGTASIKQPFRPSKRPQLELSQGEKLAKFKQLFPLEDPHEHIKASFSLICDDITEIKHPSLIEVLKCNDCGSAITLGEQNAKCENGHSVLFDGNTFDFRNDQLKKEHNITNNSDVASRSHDPLALALIGKYKEGLILDCGAGLPKQNFKNVVNLEIEKFANTDVQGVGESLPFQDNSFDLVFSFSVLEHVKDPFQAAGEINRVLKPGGILYANTPFLIPVHGYPHHYYNMTMQGLKNLFPTMNVVAEGVPSSGHPYYAVQSVLGIWASHLAPGDAEIFKNLTVREILERQDEIIDKGMCQNLPQDIQKIISCTNSIVAIK